MFDLGIVRDKSLVKVMRFPMLHDKIWVYAIKTYLQLYIVSNMGNNSYSAKYGMDKSTDIHEVF